MTVDGPTGRPARFSLFAPVQVVYVTAPTVDEPGPVPAASISTNSNGNDSAYDTWSIATAAELEELQPVDQPPPAYTDWQSG